MTWNERSSFFFWPFHLIIQFAISLENGTNKEMLTETRVYILSLSPPFSSLLASINAEPIQRETNHRMHSMETSNLLNLISDDSQVDVGPSKVSSKMLGPIVILAQTHHRSFQLGLQSQPLYLIMHWKFHVILCWNVFIRFLLLFFLFFNKQHKCAVRPQKGKLLRPRTRCHCHYGRLMASLHGHNAIELARVHFTKHHSKMRSSTMPTPHRIPPWRAVANESTTEKCAIPFPST